MAVSPGYFSIDGFVYPWIESPDAGDVRAAELYGALATEFTGTLYVPSLPGAAPAVDMLGSLIAIVNQIPDKVDVDYYPRNTSGGSSADSYATAVSFEARRQPITSGDFDGLAKRWARWQLYATDGQPTKPKRLGKIVVDDITYHVLQVTSRWNDPTYGTLIHDCDCVQAVA